MKLYRTSRFTEIKEIEVISFDKESFQIKRGDWYSNSKKGEYADKIQNIQRFSSHHQFHETEIEAKNFLKSRLKNKINNLQSELEKCNSILIKYK